MSYTSTGGLPTIPRLAVAGVDEGAPGSASSSSGSSSGSSDPLTLTPRATPAAPASGLKLYADATGKLSWIRASDGFTRTFEVTATANRTFTIPDASFTLAGQNLANTFTLANTFSANGALSAPAVSFTGTPITGGTATTTKPLVLIETAGATSTTWSTSGTMFGVNAPSGFAGSIVEYQINGASRLTLSFGGVLTVAGQANAAGFLANATTSIGWSGRGSITSPAAGQIQLGAADAAAPVAQTLSVQSVVAGTTDTAGVNWTINGSRGTGTGVGGSMVLQVAPAGSTGSSQNSLVTALRIQPSGVGTLLQVGHSANGPYIFSFTGTTSGTPTATSSSTGLSLYSNQAATAGEDSFAFVGSPRSATSGAARDIVATRTFAPTSGTATWVGLTVNPTINQTGGANGITRGIYVNPTLTAAADFRAIEVSDGKVVIATNGAASAPAFQLSGTPYTGGTTTTTTPMFMVGAIGTASWVTGGTMIGANAPSGFTGSLIDLQQNGVSKFVIGASTGGATIATTTGNFSINFDTWLGRKAAANWQFGASDAASPVAQTLSVQSVVAGTTDTAGANFTIKGSAGTGTGAGGSIIFQVAPAGSTGTAQNAYATALTIDSTKLVTFGAGLSTGGSISLLNSSSCGWSGRAQISSPADSVLLVQNNAATSFDKIQFGGTTASFGAVARNGAGIKITLASSSSTLSDLTCSTLTTQGYTAATLPAAGTAGRIAYVTDATAPTYRGALVGGGAVTCLVFDTGAAWVTI